MPGEFLLQFFKVTGNGEDSQCGKCHQAGTEQATLEVIGSNRAVH